MAGDYAAQAISADSSKTATARVVFMPVSNAQVRVGGVRVSGSYVELRNLQTTWRVQPGVTGVVLRNVISPGPFSITGASQVSVLGGEVFSPVPVATDSQIASLNGMVPTDILIDGVAFHDFHDVGPGNFHHIECLQVGAAINLTIRNSKFWNCATHNIFIRSWGMANNSPSPLSNIVIENNWLSKTTDGFYGLQVLDDLWKGTPKTSFVLRNNSSLQSFVIRVDNGTASVIGNILPSMSPFFCNSYGQNKWFDYNLYGSGAPCGAHDRVGDPRFVDAATFDLHLGADSAAIAQADTASHPPLDIDGKFRPIRSRPDAGASQRETAYIGLGQSIGSASIGDSKAKIKEFYGNPRRSTAYKGPGARATLATYRAHGGLLWVVYDPNDSVVGLGTTSRYYSTAVGLGVGIPAKQVVSSLKLRWNSCNKAYRRKLGSSALYVTRGQGSNVTSLWMVRGAFDGCGRRPR
jgi:hypothetical protein